MNRSPARWLLLGAGIAIAAAAAGAVIAGVVPHVEKRPMPSRGAATLTHTEVPDEQRLAAAAAR